MNKQIILSDDKAQLISLMGVLTHEGFNHEYRNSSTSLIVEVNNPALFDRLAETLRFKYNAF